MRSPRRPAPLAGVLAAALAIALAACERPKAAPPVDSAVALTLDSAVVTPPEAGQSSGWDSTAGAALYVARADQRGVAAVVFPELTDSAVEEATTLDASRVRAARVELFAPTGAAGAATVGTVASTTENECSAWPTARLVGPAIGGPAGSPAGSPAASAAGPQWTVGFTAGVATPIPLDSAGALSPADSARLAADLTRLAAALPNDTSAGLRGVPFAVREMRRFSPAPGVEAVVAAITRKLNVEASPLAEEIILVAERDSTAPPNAFTTAYFSRTSATEELVQTTDVLAAVRLGASRMPTLVLSRDLDDGSVYAVVQRVGSHRWRLRWTSAYTGC